MTREAFAEFLRHPLTGLTLAAMLADNARVDRQLAEEEKERERRAEKGPWHL